MSMGYGCSSDAGSLIPFLIIIVVMVVFFLFSRSSQKKREEEINKTLDAIQPGNKVKTIGGLCGIVVEVCPEDNTFVMETGSETSGKSYIKLDKKAVYQTDAVAVGTPAAEETPVAEEAAEETVEETPVVDEPVFEEGAPVVEETSEETEAKEE